MAGSENSKPELAVSVTTKNNGSPTSQQQDALHNTSHTNTYLTGGPNNGNNNIIRRDSSDDFPPGYRFCPVDSELIVYYLSKKVRNEPLPHDKIKEVNLYDYNPQQLSELYPTLGEKEWYFFTPRERKYRNGIRPNRKAGKGYWKATGADKPVRHNGTIVGHRKALVYYTGNPPRGDKTNWIMHEFRENAPPRSRTNANDMRLDDCVLCRIYKKADQSKAQQRGDERVRQSTASTVPEASYPLVNENRMYNSSYEEPNSFVTSVDSPFQIGLPELPPCIDHSLQNFSNFDGHPQQGHNYAAPPLGLRSPLAHSTEGVFRSNYSREDNLVPKTRGFQEDILNNPKFENNDLTDHFPNSNYMYPFPTFDNILPNDAPINPYNNNAPNHPPFLHYNAPYHPPNNPYNDHDILPNHHPPNYHPNNHPPDFPPNTP